MFCKTGGIVWEGQGNVEGSHVGSYKPHVYFPDIWLPISGESLCRGET